MLSLVGEDGTLFLLLGDDGCFSCWRLVLTEIAAAVLLEEGEDLGRAS